MKKHLCLLLAAALLLGGLAGCGPIGAGGPSLSEMPSAASGASESADAAEERYQIADGVYITPVKAGKPPEQLSDEEMTRIAAALLKQANLIWTNLFAGIPDLAVDQADSIVYDDGEKWDSLKYIHSFAEYEAITDSVFAKGFYLDKGYDYLENCMMEQNGKLYLCKERFIGVPAGVGMESNGIEMVCKEADGIQAYVRMKDADPDHASYPDILTRYTLLRQNGDWVLQSFRGETTALDFLQPLQPPSAVAAAEQSVSDTGTVSTLRIDPKVDPPLLQDIDTIAIPDFLNEEQALLYQRALSIWGIFRGNLSFMEDHMSNGAGDMVKINGLPYYKTTGKYSRLDDFLRLLNSIFVPEYTQKLLDPLEQYNIILDVGGILYFGDGGKGIGYFHVPPDAFELLMQAKDMLRFYLIGHYSDSVSWTEKFPIEMVLTPNGWRLSRFATTVNDNTDPPVCRDFVHE